MSTVAEPTLVAMVDDDPSMIKLVSLMLSNANIRLETFMTGAALLKSAALKNYNTIILDLSIPDAEGFHIMDKLVIKNITATILLISGHDHVILMAAKAYGDGMGLNLCGALRKPFTQPDLLAALGLPLNSAGS
jgi:FixJ family two-component response regulator